MTTCFDLAPQIGRATPGRRAATGTAFCHNENICSDKSMQYHAGTYDSAPHPRFVGSYPMNAFNFRPNGAYIGRHSAERIAEFDVKQRVQA